MATPLTEALELFCINHSASKHLWAYVLVTRLCLKKGNTFELFTLQIRFVEFSHHSRIRTGFLNFHKRKLLTIQENLLSKYEKKDILKRTSYYLLLKMPI